MHEPAVVGHFPWRYRSCLERYGGRGGRGGVAGGIGGDDFDRVFAELHVNGDRVAEARIQRGWKIENGESRKSQIRDRKSAS